MEYKMNPEIGKIISPVKIVWNGVSGNKPDCLMETAEEQTWIFENGRKACEAVFSRKFNVLQYEAVDGQIVIQVYEFCEMNPKR